MLPHFLLRGSKNQLREQERRNERLHVWLEQLPRRLGLDAVNG
jgi:hypothetical protein